MNSVPNTDAYPMTDQDQRSSMNPVSSEAIERPRGISIQTLLDQEDRPVPTELRNESYVYLGSEDLPVAAYTSQEFSDREVRHVWRKVWQFACRVEDIPEVGDHVLYEVGPDCLIVTRSAPNRIQAFYNACLHRGTMLRTTDGTVPEFRCPYHAFTWNLDGTLKDIPSQWDFPHVKVDDFCLPEAKVDIWGGFVFVNMDSDSESLAVYLEDLPDRLEHWPMDQRWKAVHVEKVMPANWKACQDAFLEAYHVFSLHPQDAYYVGDENTENSIYPDRQHYNRGITATGIPSPRLGDNYEAEDVTEALQRVWGDDAQAVPEGKTPRQIMADARRAEMAKETGMDFTHATDCEMLDGIMYTIFPNTMVWAGIGAPLILRFRPYGNDPTRSVMDTFILSPVPPGTEMKKAPAPTRLSLEQPWSDAPELGGLANTWQQDTDNLRNLQRGLGFTRKPGVTLANYQEVRIRHYHQTLSDYINRGLAT